MKNVYLGIGDSNGGKKRKVLDDMIANFISKSNLEHFHHKIILWGCSKFCSFRLYCTLFFMKIWNKLELQQTLSNYLVNIGFNQFMRISKRYANEPYSSLANDTTLSWDRIIQI